MARDQSHLAGPSLPIGNVIEVPGVGDHEFEVVVVVDGRADVSVVLDELAQRNLPIAVFRMLKCVVYLESV